MKNSAYPYHRTVTNSELVYLLRRLLDNDLGETRTNQQTAEWLINERWKRYDFDWEQIKHEE